ncbi:caspase regulator ring finger domain-containing [Anaeramoeba flamelloides]|uniref:Caspase regulator ring finger domain-containing n=1 Tax=Anaeramoeba flamelloides TaxID=1746091 RepID=A0AAV7Z6F3_9EUKA|nr:caspase regulator ring finger domain-containing [Anaeramoeba flamelloides]
MEDLKLIRNYRIYLDKIKVPESVTKYPCSLSVNSTLFGEGTYIPSYGSLLFFPTIHSKESEFNGSVLRFSWKSLSSLKKLGPFISAIVHKNFCLKLTFHPTKYDLVQIFELIEQRASHSRSLKPSNLENRLESSLSKDNNSKFDLEEYKDLVLNPNITGSLLNKIKKRKRKKLQSKENVLKNKKDQTKNQKVKNTSQDQTKSKLNQNNSTSKKTRIRIEKKESMKHQNHKDCDQDQKKQNHQGDDKENFKQDPKKENENENENKNKNKEETQNENSVDNDQNVLCSLCCESKCNVKLAECGHQLCNVCAERLLSFSNNCPWCTRKYTKIVNI